MKLVSYTHAGRPGWGAVVGDGIVDLGRRLPRHATLRELIATDALAEARAAMKDQISDHALGAVMLLPPIPVPDKILCIGVNYADRNEEYKDNSALPKYPSLFLRTPGSFVGHGRPLERPRISEQLDYEGEIALVVGKSGRHIRRETALSHVFGLTLCNEGTIRDWTRHGKFNVTQGKNFDRSGALGPWIVPADTIDLAAPITLTTRVNGEVRQHDSTARLIFPIDYLISYLSTFSTLVPGDIIVTGTPTGAGARFDPPRWLKPGDRIEIEASGIGTLVNTVADEA